MPLKNLRQQIKEASNREHAALLQRFFKTGKGEYGEGDIFAGIKVPPLRNIAKKNLDLSFNELQEVISSPVHEERLACLMILVLRYAKADEETRKNIFNFYIKNRKYINNWDLVDLSAPHVVGAYLYEKDRSILYRLANSRILWDKRIAVISTFYFLKREDFKDVFAIADILLKDKHDLIHKAVGWMLREVGKRDIFAEEQFLEEHYRQMPRTMLRYAIERFPDEKRLAYLKGRI